MAGDWLKATLGDVVSLQRGHDLPEDQRIKGDVPVIGSFGLTGYHNAARAKGPGVTIGRSGASFGTTSFVTGDYWPLNTCMYVTDFKGNSPKFCYYLFKTIDFAGYNSGSAQPSLNRNFIYSIELCIPPRKEQDRIVNLLGSLDDKIELNRSMAMTLEEMARALFKSWFVDFDPVHAKANGHSTGLSAATAGLFPDSFGEDGKPKGWSGTAEDIGLNVRQQVLPTDVDPNTPYVGLEHVEKRRLALERIGRADEVESQKAVFKQGDLLFGKLRPYFHKVAIAPVSGICSTDIFVFRPQKGIPRTYLYLAFSADEFVAKASGAQEGTRMPRADWGFMRKQPMARPTSDILAEFDNIAAPLIERVLAANAEVETLTSLRNALLLKLISGELRIKDGEAIGAAA